MLASTYALTAAMYLMTSSISFVCRAYQTLLTPSDLWSRPTDEIREIRFLEDGNPDYGEQRLKQ